MSAADWFQIIGSSPGVEPATAASPIAPESLPPGLSDHPDYQIIRELGRGGMGVVYLAHNKLMGRDEVLKVMGRHVMERPGVLDRFLREIRAVAKLHHPNIVAAYHATRAGESIVFAMEYVKGYDLSQLVKSQQSLPVAVACNFVYQAALGLQHAHEKGLIHRDVKPSNLMVAREGERPIIKVLDFGLARLTREESVDLRLTSTGQAIGTPDFIAPEQILDAQSVDIRADIYSLGGTLYCLLSGHPPFQEKSLYDVYQAHISRDADPLNLVRRDVPAELAAVVAKMMAKDPQQRFQTPGEVAEALAPLFKSGARPNTVAHKEQAGPARAKTLIETPNTGSEPMLSGANATPASTPSAPKTAWVSGPGAIPAGLIQPDGQELNPQVNLPGLRVWRQRWKRTSLALVVAFLGLAFIGVTWRILFGSETPLLYGADLEGWKGYKDGQIVPASRVFRVDREKTELVSTGQDGAILHEEPLSGDFSFKFEYFLPLDGGSDGALAILRLDDGKTYHVADSSFRVGVIGCSLRDTTSRFGRTGDIIPYHFESGQPSAFRLRSRGGASVRSNNWNRFEIRCAGQTIAVLLDGVEVNCVEASGPVVCNVGFQQLATDIRIRNVRVRNGGLLTGVSSKPHDPLQAGTVWRGDHSLFVKSMPARRSQRMSLEILERNGEHFKARWEAPYDRRVIRGTVKNGAISWSADDVTCQTANGKYDTTGTLRGDRLDLRYSGTLTEEGRQHEFRAEVPLEIDQ